MTRKTLNISPEMIVRLGRAVGTARQYDDSVAYHIRRVISRMDLTPEGLRESLARAAERGGRPSEQSTSSVPEKAAEEN